MSTLSSMHACEERETGEVECKTSTQTCPAVHMHMSSRQCDSRCYSYRKSPATQLTDCHVVSELLGILAAGAIPNHLHIAGVLQIPHSIVLLMKGACALPIGWDFVRNSVKSSHVKN